MGVNLTTQSPGVNSIGVNMHCGAGINRHFYGPWQRCEGTSCPANTCTGDVCPDSSETTTCIQVRTLTYTVPYTINPNIDMKPNISDQSTFYRKCSYMSDMATPGCAQPDYAAGEQNYINSLVTDNIKDCGILAPDYCSQLCGLFNGEGENGCKNQARQCYFITDTEFGKGCGLSGWEQGSGLECTDSYRRLIYTVYSCPMGSDYFHDIETQSGASTQPFYQYREVTCVHEGFTSEDTSSYCDKQFLTLDVGHS